MARKRTSFLKRQKEQKRIEKAVQKREGRMQRRFEQPNENTNPLDADLNEESISSSDTVFYKEAIE